MVHLNLTLKRYMACIRPPFRKTFLSKTFSHVPLTFGKDIFLEDTVLRKSLYKELPISKMFLCEAECKEITVEQILWKLSTCTICHVYTYLLGKMKPVDKITSYVVLFSSEIVQFWSVNPQMFWVSFHRRINDIFTFFGMALSELSFAVTATTKSSPDWLIDLV